MTHTPETTDAETATDAKAADEQATTGNQEAAKYRRQLRKAEAERDAALQRLETLQRAEIERIAVDSAHMRDGSDLWADNELATFLDDEGNVSKENVATAAQELVDAKPHYRTPYAPNADGMGRVGESIPGSAGMTWGDAFKTA